MAQGNGSPATAGEPLVVCEDGRPCGLAVRPGFVWIHPSARGRGLERALELADQG